MLFLNGCSPIEYPITTRYREPNSKLYAPTTLIENTRPKIITLRRYSWNPDILIFSVGTILLWNYIERAK